MDRSDSAESRSGREVRLESEEAVVGPGSTVIVSVFPVRKFACQRIVFRPPPASRWWRLKCLVRGLVANAFHLFGNVTAWLGDGEVVWALFYEHPPDERLVLDIRVGGLPQLRGWDGGVPVNLFYEDSLDGAMMSLVLCFDEAGPDLSIGLAVMNKSKEPVRASFTAVGRYVI